MKEVEVNGRRYVISDVPPWFIGRIRVYANLVAKNPASYEEAEKIDNEIEKVFNALSRFISPQPQTCDMLKLLNEVIRYWSESYVSISEEAELFRPKRAGQGGRQAGVADSPKAEQAHRPEGGEQP